MPAYTYSKPKAEVGLLAQEMREAGIPLECCLGPDEAGAVTVVTTVALSANQLATVQTIVDLHPASVLPRLRLSASNLFSKQSDQQLLLRSVALVACDEINLLRSWVSQFKAAVAASTSLADLKARVANLPDLPQRTPAQAKAAVVQKNTTGEAD